MSAFDPKRLLISRSSSIKCPVLSLGAVHFLTTMERMMADQVHWQFSGDYFENCSCTVVCPCLVSKSPPLTSRPTEGVCNVPLIFHIESGRFGDTVLDGLNVALAVHTPGPMAEGNWSVDPTRT